ncbi:hypothetical protein ACFB49_22690 [Sphingomonas sp. DBB INV C78]|uniref:DUF1552 domain-containing protein n=1 Tax=Sphingomonas sp. DBB INV C78 TaxID=3349434 RepID=UPI0036D20D72
MSGIGRRGFLLRGALGGAAVTVGLPFLNLFLDGNGSALAAPYGGGRLPVRFGTWFWGCGMIPDRWTPKKAGGGYDLPPELQPIAAVQDRVNILSGFSVGLEGRSNQPHISGNIGLRTGVPADSWQQIEAPTLDVLVADAIGAGSFFRSLELSADGNPRTSFSYRNGSTMNAGVATPAELYRRIFGPEFRDPNAADFRPDPRVMARRSVLSAVTEERRHLIGRLGAEDRAKVDGYFTAIREVETKLSLQLEKPLPAEACRVPGEPQDLPASTDVGDRQKSHQVMTELLAMALACNQTKVFNMVFSTATADLRQAGATTGYHQATHEELVDRDKGYQPTVDNFSTQSMKAWADFVATLSALREGDGTLLDNMLVLAHSDVSFAKNHDVNGIPMMLAGRAGGKVRTGLHVASQGDPVTRVGLTVQQALGMPVEGWGRESMRTTRAVSEILV